MAFRDTVISACKLFNEEVPFYGCTITDTALPVDFRMMVDYGGFTSDKMNEAIEIMFNTGVYSDPQIRNWSNCIGLCK